VSYCVIWSLTSKFYSFFLELFKNNFKDFIWTRKLKFSFRGLLIYIHIKHIQWNLCNPTPEFSDILWHPTKIYGPKAFLFTKIKAEYSDTLYNPTHFPVPLVCWFRQVQLYIRNLLTSPMGRVKVVQCNFKHYFSYIMSWWSESEYYVNLTCINRIPVYSEYISWSQRGSV
jgi:hypothetical protein